MTNVIPFPDRQGLTDDEIARRADPLAESIMALLTEQTMSVQMAALSSVLAETYTNFTGISQRVAPDTSTLPPDKFLGVIVMVAMRILEDE